MALRPLSSSTLGARDDRARVGLGRRVRHGLAAAVLGALHVDRLLVELVVLRERLAPFGRVVDVVVEGRARVLLRVGLRDAGCGNEQKDDRERGQDRAGENSQRVIAACRPSCGRSLESSMIAQALL